MGQPQIRTRTDPSLDHLLRRLALVDGRVREAVLRRRADRAAPVDPFRGLYLSDADIDRLLADPVQHGPTGGFDELTARVEAGAEADEAVGARLRLRWLCRAFRLQPVDVEMLLIVLAPELDQRFERLYGYLHDDVTRRRPTVGLVLELVGAPAVTSAGRARLRPGAPLVDGGLVEVLEPDRPFLSRTLRANDRIAMYLLGDDTPEQILDGLITGPGVCLSGDPAALAATLRRGASLCYLRERQGSSPCDLASAAFAELDMPTLAIDLNRLDGRDAAVVGAVARREAKLRGAGLVAGPVEVLGDAVTAFCDPDWPVALYGRRSWDPRWSVHPPLCVETPPIASTDLVALWTALLDGDAEPDLDVAGAVGTARLEPRQVARAVDAAGVQAAHLGRPIGREELRFAIRSQNAAGLDRLARRIEPSVGWSDIVLPPRPLRLLRELAARARHRDMVLDEWGMRQGGGRGGGISALFAGPSGTGKTMAAEVIAYELGFDLYTVDLATVVDKYIGETEKNLECIFSEAERVNGVLFFDEADALFGKRSEVKDAHDRYANVETAYLLQRMEIFDGVAILATNLSANLDEAFTRRLDGLIDFPAPDAEHRRQIWERALRPGVPRSPDVDLDEMARRFELAGGNIRNIALSAAYFAAEEGRPVSMADLMRGTAREFVKLGRLFQNAEFAPYEAAVS